MCQPSASFVVTEDISGSCHPPLPRSTTLRSPPTTASTRSWKSMRADRNFNSVFWQNRGWLEAQRNTKNSCSYQLTTQPPERLFGQTILGQSPSTMASFTVMVFPEQLVVVWSRSGQSATNTRYSFPQTGQSQVCLSHISRYRWVLSNRF